MLKFKITDFANTLDKLYDLIETIEEIRKYHFFVKDRVGEEIVVGLKIETREKYKVSVKRQYLSSYRTSFEKTISLLIGERATLCDPMLFGLGKNTTKVSASKSSDISATCLTS